MIKNITLLVIIAFAFSCAEKGDNVESLKKEVMGIHDEVMPEMGNLRKTQKQLVEAAAGADAAMANTMIQLAAEIDEANEMMMDWMRNYEPNYEGTPAEEMDYLKQQKESIARVRETMQEALKKGNEALAK